MKRFLVLTSFIFSLTCINAQRILENSITGKVFDQNEKVPLEYSNIILFKQSDSSQVNGTVTDKNGVFRISSIKPDDYYLKISFLGYESIFIDNLKISARTNLDLGTKFLKGETFSTNDVVISGDRAPVSYQIDKKVINVSGQLTTLSGTAVDVLENVPSVTVDIEGNVSLRGSSNFTVLIDGKPSVLEGSEALQNIPATSIENIEIITNPSAKYNPEGTAGIINVLTKKNSLDGISGVANLNGGSGEKYGGDGLFDYKYEKMKFNFGIDYNKRIMEIESKTNNWTLFNTVKNYNSSSGSSNRGRESYGVRGSLSYNFTTHDILTLNGRYGFRNGLGGSNLDYFQWTNISALQNKYTTRNDRSQEGSYYSTGLNYSHDFAEKGHMLTADFIFQHRNSDEYTIYKQFNSIGNIVEGKKQTENGPSTSYEIKVDYSYPITPESKFEAGYNGDINRSQDVSDYLFYDTTKANFYLDNLYSKNINYNQNIHALYSMYSNQFDAFGLQLGIRTELTDRLISLKNTNESYSINNWDYFPTLHFSYKLNEADQLMASYTRRIDRPHGWELEPFVTWMDPYNVRIGNPSLKPEFIDSYELSFQKLLNKSLFSADLYYRINNNKVEHIQSAYSENVTLNSVENVGKDYSFGSELMFNFDPFKFWNVNLMGNLYKYQIVGNYNNISFDRNSFNWNTRFNNSFNLSPSTQIQINLFYNSPTVSAQGTQEGFLMTNAAFRQLFLDKTLALTLQVRDLFGTAKRESTSSSYDFYRYNYFKPESPVVMLNLRFNFNNYKNKDKSERDNSGSDVEGGEDF
jgi:outer membrane receptor protein involved in Fe transport